MMTRANNQIIAAGKSARIKPTKLIFPYDQVRVGVGVLLYRVHWNSTGARVQVLLGPRLVSHGAGEWAAPGGKIELWEGPKRASCRETLEEVGVEIKQRDLKFVCYTDDRYRKESRHFITLFFATQTWKGRPRNLEPKKCGKLRWHDVNSLPTPIMKGTRKAIEVLNNWVINET